MKRKSKKSTLPKKRLNLFTSLLLLLIVSAGILFMSQQTQQNQGIISQAEMTCTTPGGCGGDCNPAQNNGCGYGGCRFWEYCADENKDGVYSCHWKQPPEYTKPEDYAGACHEKSNKNTPESTTNNNTNTDTNTSKNNNERANTTQPTNTPVPAQNGLCNNASGCGGNCNPHVNSGCGYGGCRAWEYCADKNNDGVPSCEWDNDPAFKTCEQIQTTPRPTGPVTVVTTQPTSSPTNVTQVSPQPSTADPDPSSIPTQLPTIKPVNNNLGSLCVPVEVNGSQSDKMDFLIIPYRFSPDEVNSQFPQLSKMAVDSLKKTNLTSEVLNKMNWYMLNTNDVSYQTNLTPVDSSNTDELLNRLFNYGKAANFCGRIFI